MGTDKLKIFSIADWLPNARFGIENVVRAMYFASQLAIEKIFSISVLICLQ